MGGGEVEEGAVWEDVSGFVGVVRGAEVFFDLGEGFLFGGAGGACLGWWGGFEDGLGVVSVVGFPFAEAFFGVLGAT